MASLEYRKPRESEEEGTFVFYADEVTMQAMGQVVKFTFWERRGCNGKLVPLLEVIRPRSTVACSCQMLRETQRHN